MRRFIRRFLLSCAPILAALPCFAPRAHAATTEPLTLEMTPSAPLPAPSLADSVSSEVRDILTALQKKHASLATVSGEFKQLLKSQQFLEEITSEGVFYYKKPDSFRADYHPPTESINYVLGNTAYIYTPEIKQVDVYKLQPDPNSVKNLHQLLLGFGLSVEELLKAYTVVKDEEKSDAKKIVLIFHERKYDENFPFEQISISLNRESLLPTNLVLTGKNEDITYIDVKKLELNPELRASLFEPKFPKDVEIVEQN